LLTELSSASEAGVDFVMPDCVLDPGFRLEAQGQVVGMLQNVVANLVAKGHKVGAVTRNEAIGAELERRVEEYGFAQNYVGREVLNLSFDAINDEELWHEALTKAVDSLAAQGATVVINGCSAVNVQQDRLKLEVVDPAELALQIISAN
jgi:Asp/Glu/hydantoin racemase